MGILSLLKAGVKRQIVSIGGVLILVLIIVTLLITSLTVSVNSGQHIENELLRLGYGDITAWVSGTDSEILADEIAAIDEVESIGVQKLIFADYTISGKQSDNKGQLIVFDEQKYPYYFLNDSMTATTESQKIQDGEIFISPAMKSSYNVTIGSEIRFIIARTGSAEVLVVKGYFQDPFMGSSMIDMKGFLINENSFNKISKSLESMPEYDVSAKIGAMLHIFQSESSLLGSAEFNRVINAKTQLDNYTEFVYNDNTIISFMLILQNIFTGILIVFVVVLTIVSMIVMGHSISSAIEQDYVDMGILKTVGFTSAKLKILQLAQYAIGIFIGIILGLCLSFPVVRLVASLTITSTGILMPTTLPLFLCVLSLISIFVLLAVFILIKTNAISKVSPLQSIKGETNTKSKKVKTTLRSNGLAFRLAFRSVVSGKRRYIGTFVVAILLVFVLSTVGKMNAWLGFNGEGMMNAFSVANHDLGVQPTSELDISEVEKVVNSYSPIIDRYELAMQSVTVNGIDYTANAINEPERFHILLGETSNDDNEIVVTEFVAKELGIGIGDYLSVGTGRESLDYIVTGIYQCANEMGGNIGMSREGYERIGNASEYIWCYHYILEDSSVNESAMIKLQDIYRGRMQVHTNSWSGLNGIVDSLQMLTMIMYCITALFILVVMLLTSGKLLFSEQKDMAILRSIGFTPKQLRLSFALRFTIVVAIGAILGTILSSLFANMLIETMLKLFGIGAFASSFSFIGNVMPPLVVIVLFSFFAFFVSRKIKNTNYRLLVV